MAQAKSRPNEHAPSEHFGFRAVPIMLLDRQEDTRIRPVRARSDDLEVDLTGE